MPVFRKEVAASVLSDLMADGYDPDLILTGPGISPEDRAILVEVDDWNTPNFEILSMDNMSRLRPNDPMRTFDEKEQDEIRALLVRMAIDQGEPTFVRDDGVAFYNLIDTHKPGDIMAQVAVENDGAPVQAGVYFMTGLLVEPEYRGRGVGADLVVEHILANGGARIWNNRPFFYSEGGVATHKASLTRLERIAGFEPNKSIGFAIGNP